MDAIAARWPRRARTFLRGGAYKPRTSPYAFQGHGEEALRWLRRAADANHLKVVTEALGEADVALVAEYADLVQVGSRNMQNFALLKAAGRAGRPVLLKRAMAATVEEWLLAGEYLLSTARPG
jgi:3-deoxy-7-phosphoheptulonate synthase